MLETVLQLLNAKGNRKIGNHHKEVRGGVISYFYMGNPVVVIDHAVRVVYVHRYTITIKGMSRVCESYLMSSTYKYLTNTANAYKIVEVII